MKSIKRLCSLVIMMIICMSVPMLAQTPTEAWQPPPIDQWFTQVDWIYSALIVIGGYLSKWIPGLNRITDAKWRVLAFAVLTAAGAAYFGAPILKIAISYFFSTSLYELLLKDTIGKSPQVNTDTP